MESLEDKIKRFLGDGYGYGSGYDSGDGYGDGSGSGYGIKEFAGCKVCLIDGVSTLIYSVYSTFAKGAILESDFTLKDCYIARVCNSFAHGATLHEAFDDANSKALRCQPVEDRVKSFVEAHEREIKYLGKDLFDWHNILTGSCKMGRKAFCRQHNIDISKDEFYVVDFISLTQNAYGGDVIQMLKPYYDQP